MTESNTKPVECPRCGGPCGPTLAAEWGHCWDCFVEITSQPFDGSHDYIDTERDHS